MSNPGGAFHSGIRHKAKAYNIAAKHDSLLPFYKSMRLKIKSARFTISGAYRKAGYDLDKLVFWKWSLVNPTLLGDLKGEQKFYDMKGNYRFDKVSVVTNLTMQTEAGGSTKVRYTIIMVRLQALKKDSGWKVFSITKM